MLTGQAGQNLTKEELKIKVVAIGTKIIDVFKEDNTDLVVAHLALEALQESIERTVADSILKSLTPASLSVR